MCFAGFALGIDGVRPGLAPSRDGIAGELQRVVGLIAFLLTLLASSRSAAALFGFLALITLLRGYVIGGEARDIASSSGLIAL